MNAIRRWGPLALAVTVTLVATSLPVPADVGDPTLVPWADKIAHFGLYLWFGWSLGVGLWRGETPGGGSFVLALAAAAAFAGLDEWHQAWIPTRTPSVLDWAADLVGAGAGLSSSLLLVPGWVRPASAADDPDQGRGGPPLGTAVDLHTHLMPAVDDGAQSAEAAGRAAEELARAGVAVAVATPHVDADSMAYERARKHRLSELDRGWEELRRAAGDALSLRRGAEVRLDAPSPDLSDERLRLGGSRAVLVEFGALQLPPHGERQLAELVEDGWLPVLAHPERYRGIADRPEAVGRWRDAGAALQVNCGSLIGQYGRQARETAWRLLEEGRADLLATDWHARGEVPLAPAVAELRDRGADEQARLLLETNPRRVLEGKRPSPVPPVPPASRGVLGGVRDLLRR